MSKSKNPEGQMDFLSLLSEIGAEPLFPPEVPAQETAPEVPAEKATPEIPADETLSEPVVKEEQQTPVVFKDIYKECGSCWCRDCRHNSRGEAVPREMCGKEMPCPACDDCIAEEHATVCVIGSAKEGCMTRAIMEGIYVPEEV